MSFLRFFLEQALGGKPLAPVLQQLEERALPRELDRFDGRSDNASCAGRREMRPVQTTIHALFELEPQPAHRAAPADAVERCRIVPSA